MDADEQKEPKRERRKEKDTRVSTWLPWKWQSDIGDAEDAFVRRNSTVSVHNCAQ